MSVKDVLLEIISTEKTDLQTVANFCKKISSLEKTSELENLINPLIAINQIAPNIFTQDIDLNFSEGQLVQIILTYLANENEFFPITQQRWKITSNYSKACKLFETFYEKGTTTFSELDRGMSASFQRLPRYEILGKELKKQEDLTDTTTLKLADLLIDIGKFASDYASNTEVLTKEYFLEKSKKPQETKKHPNEPKNFLEKLNHIRKTITDKKAEIKKIKELKNNPLSIDRMSILTYEKKTLTLEEKLLQPDKSDKTSESAINNQQIAQKTKEIMLECRDTEKKLKERLVEAKQLLNKNNKTRTSPQRSSPNPKPNNLQSKISIFEEKARQEGASLTIKKPKTPLTINIQQTTFTKTNQQTSPPSTTPSTTPLQHQLSSSLSSPSYSPKPLNTSTSRLFNKPSTTSQQTTTSTNHQIPSSPILTLTPTNSAPKPHTTTSPQQQLSSSSSSSSNSPKSSNKRNRSFSKLFNKSSSSQSSSPTPHKKDSGSFTKNLKDTFRLGRSKTTSNICIRRNDDDSATQSPTLSPQSKRH